MKPPTITLRGAAVLLLIVGLGLLAGGYGFQNWADDQERVCAGGNDLSSSLGVSSSYLSDCDKGPWNVVLYVAGGVVLAGAIAAGIVATRRASSKTCPTCAQRSPVAARLCGFCGSPFEGTSS